MSFEDLQGFRLSPQQRRAWQAWRGEGGAYGARCAVLLEGEVVPAALARALDGVVARHEILRTSFHRLPGMRFPVQAMAESGAAAWSDETAAAAAAEEPTAERIAELLRDGASFDPATGPVLSARLLPAGPGRHLLLLALPPVCADSRTLDNLVHDLAAVHAGEAGEAPAVRYVQFAEWQSSLLENAEAESREHWQRELAAAAGWRLPWERPGAAPFSPDAVSRRLEPATVAAAETLAARLGADLGLVLLAAWHALLWRTTGAESTTVALAEDGRGHEMFEHALGPFARWLPVRVRPVRDHRLADLVEMLRQARDTAWEHADGFAGEGSDGAGEAALPAAFELAEEPAQVGGTGVRWRIVGRQVTTERFALRLACERRGDALRATLHHDASRVDAADAERLLARWIVCLESALAMPEAPIEALDLLGAAERRHLLVEVNATAADFPREACFHHLFEAQARRTPAAPAVVFEGTSITFAELDERSNQLARHLQGLGVGPDVPVALCMDRGAELVVALLGVMKAGGAYVALEPWQPPQRLGFLLEDVEAPVVLVQAAVEERLAGWPGRRLRIDDDWDRVALESSAPVESGAAAGNLAYVVFTSGSTGRPKGVAVEHRQLVNYVTSVAERLDLPAGASYANVSTFAADLGNTAIFPSLSTGGCLHVLSLDRLADAQAVGEYFTAHGIDCLKIVPSHLEALLDQPRPELALPARRLVLGGEASRPAWVEELAGRAPDCVVYNHYGPSETTVGVLTHRVEPGGLDPRCASVPLGRPIANARVVLLDRRGEPVPEWVAGEVFVGGEPVTRGYFRRPGLTADRFLPDPFSPEPGGRRYRTGDLARRLPDGSIEFLGRADDQVKYHGFRVELNEIRLALNRVPQVRDSVVTLARDGNGRDVLVAYYVSRHEIEVAELREELRRSILEETMPNLFVHLKRLPLTLNGKIHYAALPSLDEARERARREHVAPRTPTEEVMARIWAEVLGHDRVSVDANFFELGGHSLLATRVFSRQREALQVDLPLRVLFEAPTVAALAAAVDAVLAGGGGEDGEGPRLAGPVPGTGDDDIERQLAELELLCDEEAGRLAGAGPGTGRGGATAE
ncbi:MAG TPA: amino acid adenylation domain-containing protein [Thermoanaerobaculia bacterium]|nr:amino acid adenylation domain-containing protein [Thermoanaerobaculia bacterium]